MWWSQTTSTARNMWATTSRRGPICLASPAPPVRWWCCRTGAALWTDGRYFLQAADQLAGSGIELMRMGQPNVPTIPAFLAEQLPEGGALGFDGRTVSSSFARTMEKALAAKHVRLTGEQDLVDGVWPDRPALSDKPVWELTGCGLTRSEKLAKLREKMAESDAAYLLLTGLTEIAWALNLRGGDVACTPVFLSFLLIGREDAQLCIQPQAVSADIGAKLAADGVAMRPYGDIYDILRALPAGTRVMADSATANYRIMESLSQAAVLDQPSPAILMKACKTREEVENFRAAHVKDGAALCRFLHWVKTHVGKEPITELSAAAKLAALRAQQPDFLDSELRHHRGLRPPRGHRPLRSHAGDRRTPARGGPASAGLRRTLPSGHHRRDPHHRAGPRHR